MEQKAKSVFVIIGSASAHSTNEKLVDELQLLLPSTLRLNVYTELKSLPHFDPEGSINNTPQSIIEFRNRIQYADAVIICTPEYVFSIPRGLKNAIGWCVATTVFSEKRTGIITASAQGEKGHEELQLIMRTLSAQLADNSCLLIQGIKGKINSLGKIIHEPTKSNLQLFADAFAKRLCN